MDPIVISIIVGIAGIVAGVILGKVIFAKDTRKQVEDAEQLAQKLIADAQIQAETIKKEKIIEAKERFVQLKSEHDKEVLDKNRKIGEMENRLKQKEVSINAKEGNLDKQLKDNDAIKENLNRQLEVVSQKRNELEKFYSVEKIDLKKEDDIKRLLTFCSGT